LVVAPDARVMLLTVGPALTVMPALALLVLYWLLPPLPLLAVVSLPVVVPKLPVLWSHALKEMPPVVEPP
jgi:hypothetical protein